VETEVPKKMPAPLFQPIVHLARTQLEDLVKNLDAELVLDCVSKKMFDNFSMWDLQLKKMQLNKEKGLKRLEVMLEDMENVLVELKKMVDNCLTHTKLCDNPPPSVTLGNIFFFFPWSKFDENLAKYSTKFWRPRMLGFKLGLIKSDL
jgi:hypothetical protein